MDVDKQRRTSSQWPLISVAAVTALAFGLRLINLGNSDLTFDESASILIARKPLAEMIPYLLHAFHEHPPGYYVLLSSWIQLVGESEAMLRMVSVFVGTLSIPLMYRLARAVSGVRVGLLAALILAVTPVHVFYSQNARMYPLIGALALLTWWLVLRLQATDRVRTWFALAAASFFGLTAHYYMGFVIASQAVYLLVTWRQNRRLFLKWLLWLGSPLGLAGLYVLTSPGVMGTLRTMFGSGLSSAIPVGSWRALAADLVFGPHGNLGITAWSIVLAFVALGVVLALTGRAGNKRASGVLLLCALGVPLILVSVVPETLAVRYVLFLIFPMILALTIVIEWPLSIGLHGPKVRRWLIAPALALLAALLTLNVSRLPDHYNALTSDYGRTIQYVRDNYQPGDGVICHGPWQMVMQVYYPLGDIPQICLPPQAPPLLDPATAAPQLAHWLQTYRRVWVIPVAVPQVDPANFVSAYLNQHAHHALEQPNVKLYYAPVTLTQTAGPIEFGGTIELSQVEIAAQHLTVDDALIVALTWRTLRPIDGDVQVTLDVIDQAGNVWGQRIYRPGEKFATVAEWNLGQSIVDRQAVPIDLGAPPGDYQLRVSVQRASTAELLLNDQSAADHTLLVPLTVTAPRQPIGDARVPGAAVHVRVGSSLELIAYRVPTDQFVQGGVVPVTFYWRALPGERDVNVDVALLDSDGRPLNVSRGPLGPEWYPAARWQVNEVVATTAALTIPSHSSPGDYRLQIAAHDQSGEPMLITGQATQPGFLGLWTDQFVVQRDAWPLGSIQVVARNRDFNRPNVQTPLAVKFGDELQLVGYDLDASDARPGGRLTVTYYWQALKSLDRNYVVFNHLLDEDGVQRGQRDSMPVAGLNPTPFWQAGEYIRDEYVIDIAPAAAPGNYTLDFGWYESDSGTRLPAVDATGERYRDDIAKLLDVVVGGSK